MSTLLALSPFFVVGIGALLLMLADAFAKQGPNGEPTGGHGLALGAALVLFTGGAFAGGLWMFGVDHLDVSGAAPWLLVDRFSFFFDMVICLGAGLAALVAGGYLPEHRLDRGEFYALLLFATFGAMMLAAAGDALTLFLGLETMSIGAYAMTAFRRSSARSTEGALKYFLLGSFAAAILLYGFALLYGATGHTDLVGVGAAIRGGAVRDPMVIVALCLVLAGLVFKVSAVPFHMWTPDAYEGAPTPATTYMAVAVKTAAFAMMLRVLSTVFGDPQSSSWASGWPPVLACVSVLTM